jgi:hypothetical protein
MQRSFGEVSVLGDPQGESITEQTLSLPADTESQCNRPLILSEGVLSPNPTTLALNKTRRIAVHAIIEEEEAALQRCRPR